MSYSQPILTAGVASNQSIYKVVDEPRHDIGTRAMLADGRSFYYACNRGAAIDAGHLVSAAAISVDFDDLATNTALQHATVVNVTPVGSATYAAGQLTGGYLSINSGTTGAGRTYRIKNNPATTAATAFDLELSDPIADEDFNANTTATVVPNPFSSVVLLDVSGANVTIGATVVDVPAGSTDPQYFWVQTWGVCTVRADVAGDIVGHSIVEGTTQDGSFIGFVDAAADVLHPIGINMFTTVDDDFMPVILQIMP